jgi:hypothetical protein
MDNQESKGLAMFPAYRDFHLLKNSCLEMFRISIPIYRGPCEHKLGERNLAWHNIYKF